MTRVIGELEQRLPDAAFWRAEYPVLRGVPLSAVQQALPVFFAVLYAVGVLVAVTS
ncbi:hypothetical protein AMIS_46000 [Actinoplanes missouriensis 431]|uniref:Uncharacterized protein n=1 Tax=Actinoplanes missouriensis (strain ATCC 14538 / DSM 43046 / CBS 188.64 / JCM 3121 / NBRC 102363 / NCIMB 12654 / NRRL B-3342 / UNCC 431) TaxID=512565 RepID=I0H9Y3_ACTM4|nr:hypothetical protein [Actinoplanes missouriensis]BAL89820.1 hypothetical protein AMIS_46000 [Actinoplanes missouriensis 431]